MLSVTGAVKTTFNVNSHLNDILQTCVFEKKKSSEASHIS